MKVKDIAAIIENFAPCELAMQYDNVGLIVGDGEQEVSGVALCVDVTPDIVRKAAANGDNLIVSHHPVIFRPIQKLVAGSRTGDAIIEAIKNGVSLYAAHTNCDRAAGGINYKLADMLKVTDIERVALDDIGVIGDIRSTSLHALQEEIIRLIGGEVKVYGKDVTVSRVAIVSGSGGRDAAFAEECAERGVNCVLTAEVAHNVALEFLYRGISVLEYGHYESESVFVDIIEELLNKSGCPKTDKFTVELLEK